MNLPFRLALTGQCIRMKVYFRGNQRVLLGLLLVAVLLAPCAFGEEEKPAATLRELQQRLASHLAQPRFDKALWGVKISSLATGKTLFEQNPHKLLTPASNSKLYTIALALDRLGPDFRIRTSLYSQTKPDSAGTLHGDLVVYGRGDPTLNGRLHGGDIFKALAPLAGALTNAGVKRIAGDLVGDASFLHGPEFGSGWEWDDAEYDYGAEISALTINDNLLQVGIKPGAGVGAPVWLELSPATVCVTLSNRTETAERGAKRSLHLRRLPNENLIDASGQVPLDDPGYAETVTVHNPAGLFMAWLREALARSQIAVDGKVRTVSWIGRQDQPLTREQMVELGWIESPPMRDLAREVQKPSQNLYADLLLVQVGEKYRSKTMPSDRTSEALGIGELNRFLAETGVKPGEVQFDEGSGLSRDNLATPEATVALLTFMSRHPCAEVYRDALPIAGVDGTLKNRMKGTPAAGNVRAKTGSLRWAQSLSGYVSSAAGERLVFSLMLNRYANTDPNRSAREELDKIAVMLAEFAGKSAADIPGQPR
jgi:serine-type D-Ala-D-Ala carboxypeptidase/endopeptidase (penicillin-binding protein 4)